MAEVRKFKPGSGNSAIAQALEAALGAAVRPTTPGAPPEPGRPSAKAAPAVGATGLPLASAAAGGWVSIAPTKAPLVPKHHAEDEDDLLNEDDPAEH